MDLCTCTLAVWAGAASRSSVARREKARLWARCREETNVPVAGAEEDSRLPGVEMLAGFSPQLGVTATLTSDGRIPEVHEQRYEMHVDE